MSYLEEGQVTITCSLMDQSEFDVVVNCNRSKPMLVGDGLGSAVKYVSPEVKDLHQVLSLNTKTSTVNSTSSGGLAILDGFLLEDCEFSQSSKTLFDHTVDLDVGDSQSVLDDLQYGLGAIYHDSFLGDLQEYSQFSGLYNDHKYSKVGLSDDALIYYSKESENPSDYFNHLFEKSGESDASFKYLSQKLDESVLQKPEEFVSQEQKKSSRCSKSNRLGLNKKRKQKVKSKNLGVSGRKISSCRKGRKKNMELGSSKLDLKSTTVGHSIPFTELVDYEVSDQIITCSTSNESYEVEMFGLETLNESVAKVDGSTQNLDYLGCVNSSSNEVEAYKRQENIDLLGSIQREMVNVLNSSSHLSHLLHFVINDNELFYKVSELEGFLSRPDLHNLTSSSTLDISHRILDIKCYIGVVFGYVINGLFQENFTLDGVKEKAKTLKISNYIEITDRLITSCSECVKYLNYRRTGSCKLTVDINTQSNKANRNLEEVSFILAIKSVLNRKEGSAEILNELSFVKSRDDCERNKNYRYKIIGSCLNSSLTFVQKSSVSYLFILSLVYMFLNHPGEYIDLYYGGYRSVSNFKDVIKSSSMYLYRSYMRFVFFPDFSDKVMKRF